MSENAANKLDVRQGARNAALLAAYRVKSRSYQENSDKLRMLHGAE